MALSTTAAGKLAALIQEIDEDKGMEFERLSAELSAVFGMMVEEREKRAAAEEASEIRGTRTQGPFSARPTRERPEAYAKLMDVLNRAHDQAAFGKGLDRHVSKEAQPFHEQPICSLQRIYGNGYAFGQAGKKTEESMRLPKEQALAELLGAINYIAAAYIVREEQDETGPGNA